MTNYLCAVSGKFPENYEIGLRANTWGVVEGYKSKLSEVCEGDRLAFLVGGEFRSIHKIEGMPYFDETPLWPHKDGSVFPHRISISNPVASGHLVVSQIVSEISFMKNTQRWQGTIQGPHGVFNSRLTDEDMLVIQNQLTEVLPRVVKAEPERITRLAESIRTFQTTESDLREQLFQLLPELGLRMVEHGKNIAVGRECIDALCLDKTGKFVVVLMHKGQAPKEILLRILRDISWVRQHNADGKDVRGIILTEAVEDDLLAIANELPTISFEYYRLGIRLVGRAAS